jgi:release factor glutamine methyltransferase
VRRWEPGGALFAGPEGLDDYRVLIPQLPALLAEGGAAVLEIGAAQAGQVADLAAASGFASELRRDLAGRPRALVLRLGLGKQSLSHYL